MADRRFDGPSSVADPLGSAWLTQHRRLRVPLTEAGRSGMAGRVRMRCRFDTVPRVVTAVLLAVGVLVAPGPGAAASVALAADCPSPPVTIGKLVSLDLVPGNTCYGGRLLTFRAFVPPPCDGCGGTSTTVIRPRWLDGLLGSSVNLSTGPNDAQVSAYVPPALGRCSSIEDLATCPFHSYYRRWVTVSAHFDGPVAQTCSYAQHPPGKEFSKSAAVAECRQKLIVLSVGPDVTSPATDTVAPSPVGRDGPSTPLPWVATFALVTLVLAWRSPSARSLVPRRRTGSEVRETPPGADS
jgi:hypothetical protein